MLGSLPVLVLAALFVPPMFGKHDGTYELKDVFQYRSTVLGVILTDFGAWIGAGAAYFFGRENLKTATETMMEMREPSAQERLRRTAVRDIPPGRWDWKPRLGDHLIGVYNRLTQYQDYWFIPVFDDESNLITVMNEEAFWRYVSGVGHSKPAEANGEVCIKQLGETPDPKMKSVREFLADIGGAELQKRLGQAHAEEASEGASRYGRLLDIYVSCTLDEGAADVYRRMAHWRPGEEARLAIVFGENGKPTHFFTTEEVRRLLIDVT